MMAFPKSLNSHMRIVFSITNSIGRLVFCWRFKISTAKCWNWVRAQTRPDAITPAPTRLFRSVPCPVEQGPVPNLSPPMFAPMLWQPATFVSVALCSHTYRFIPSILTPAKKEWATTYCRN